MHPRADNRPDSWAAQEVPRTTCEVFGHAAGVLRVSRKDNALRWLASSPKGFPCLEPTQSRAVLKLLNGSCFDGFFVFIIITSIFVSSVLSFPPT